ncbi:MAG: cation transporter [Candidatus Marinimicrobia bacterium]|jgi:cation diffusion facilitator family transporter|nr:cation transporter [Candidatus Neomarinimicrobiota bacterium]MBT3618026.1 cation transporter [Candidatus Neomarinimicrobiota bacterium]MBT3828517.1 cation transporter [Candidatus Neomarinimicrobiota bacterium]MBT3998012.1 cation transporter [Candidatus Neomarinimicrobiota bacterium]MBT4280284.1 cation transporter [Candidatus Neomarinimicrobiota bacterium]
MFERFTQYWVPKGKEPAGVYRINIGVFQGWISVLINTILFVLKLMIGVMAGAISVIADAFHTLADVIGSLVVIWGFHESKKPPDPTHPYGYGRAEYIATLIIAVFLGVAGIEFVQASFERIMVPTPINPEWWMIYMISFTVIIKEITARYGEFLSKKIASGTLHADAWHHRSDALSSLIVVFALIASKMGYLSFDGWAGLGVAAFILWTGFHIARDAVDDLLGKPPTEDELETIREMVVQVDGVLGIHDITVHSYGREKFISMHIEIDADEPPAQAHDISEKVEDVVKKNLNVEPTVHMDPIHPQHPIVNELRDHLNHYCESNDQITNVHDIRVVDTPEHQVILFGMNLTSNITHTNFITCENEIRDSVKSKFPEFEVEIKVSPYHRY